jgi:3-keto-5-aminohexanoate cleavage enzyme
VEATKVDGGFTMRPVIIAVAITGSVPRKKENPALPVLPTEQIESTHAAYEAGATLVHIHVRNDDESPSSDPDRFAAVQAGVRKHCPGMIVQFSTGGRGRDPAARSFAVPSARHGLTLDRFNQFSHDRV